MSDGSPIGSSNGSRSSSSSKTRRRRRRRRRKQEPLQTQSQRRGGRPRRNRTRWKQHFEPILGQSAHEDDGEESGNLNGNCANDSGPGSASASGEDPRERKGLRGHHHRHHSYVDSSSSDTDSDSSSSSSSGGGGGHDEGSQQRRSHPTQRPTSSASVHSTSSRVSGRPSLTGPQARVHQRNREHIRRLEEQNRRKREAQELAKSVGTKLREERRRNFNLNFAGANQSLAVKRNMQVRESSSRHRRRVQQQQQKNNKQNRGRHKRGAQRNGRQHRNRGGSEGRAAGRGRSGNLRRSDNTSSASSSDSDDVLPPRSVPGLSKAKISQLSLDETKVRGPATDTSDAGYSTFAADQTLPKGGGSNPLDDSGTAAATSKSEEYSLDGFEESGRQGNRPASNPRGTHTDCKGSTPNDASNGSQDSDGSSSSSGSPHVFNLDAGADIDLDVALNVEGLDEMWGREGESSEEMDPAALSGVPGMSDAASRDQAPLLQLQTAKVSSPGVGHDRQVVPSAVATSSRDRGSKPTRWVAEDTSSESEAIVDLKPAERHRPSSRSSHSSHSVRAVPPTLDDERTLELASVTTLELGGSSVKPSRHMQSLDAPAFHSECEKPGENNRANTHDKTAQIREVLVRILHDMPFSKLEGLLKVLVSGRDEVGTSTLNKVLSSILPIGSLPMEAFEFVAGALDIDDTGIADSADLPVLRSGSDKSGLANETFEDHGDARLASTGGTGQPAAGDGKKLFSTLRIAANSKAQAAAAAAASTRSRRMDAHGRDSTREPARAPSRTASSATNASSAGRRGVISAHRRSKSNPRLGEILSSDDEIRHSQRAARAGQALHPKVGGGTDQGSGREGITPLMKLMQAIEPGGHAEATASDTTSSPSAAVTVAPPSKTPMANLAGNGPRPLRLRRTSGSDSRPTSTRHNHHHAPLHRASPAASGSGSSSAKSVARSSRSVLAAAAAASRNNTPKLPSGRTADRRRPENLRQQADTGCHGNETQQVHQDRKLARSHQFLFKSLKLKIARQAPIPMDAAQPFTHGDEIPTNESFEHTFGNSTGVEGLPSSVSGGRGFTQVVPDSDEDLLDSNAARNLSIVDTEGVGKTSHTHDAVAVDARSAVADLISNTSKLSSTSSNRPQTPELPAGCSLQFVLCSNWGDPYLVGLAAIELFDSRGDPLPRSMFSLSLESADGKALRSQRGPGNAVVHHHMSRSLSQSTVAEHPSANHHEQDEDDKDIPLGRLVDGCNFTCDPHHMWSTSHSFGSTAPSSSTKTPQDKALGRSASSPSKLLTALGGLPADSVVIVVRFNSPAPTALSLIRIWNFNTSRVASACGVRDLKILLDGETLFAGEVPQASGQLTRASDCCATVLLTRQQGILDRVMRRDHRRARMTRTARPPTPKESRIYNGVHCNTANARTRHVVGLDQCVEITSGASSGRVDRRPAAAAHAVAGVTHGSTGALVVAEECGNEYEVNSAGHRPDHAAALHAVESASASGTSDEESNVATSSKRRPKRSLEAAMQSKSPLASGNTEVSSGINFAADPNDTATVSLVKTIMGRMHRHRPNTASSVATHNARPRTASDDSFQGRQFTHRDQGVANGALTRTPSHGSSLGPTAVPTIAVASDGDDAKLEASEDNSYSDFQRRVDGSLSPFVNECALPSVGGFSAPRLPPPECACNLMPQYVAGSTLVLTFTQNWGDHELIGLTGIEVYVYSNVADVRKTERSSLSIVLAKPLSIAATSDVNDLLAMKMARRRDPRTADKLIDGCNMTTKSRHMWLAPCVRSGSQSITLRLPYQHGSPPIVACLRIWNYNKNISDSFRGARCMRVSIDGQALRTPKAVDDSDFVVRKAPGTSLFDFGQLLWMQPPCEVHHQHLIIAGQPPTGVPTSGSVRPSMSLENGYLQHVLQPVPPGPGQQQLPPALVPFMVRSMYDTSQQPRGFVFKLRLYSTAGDPFYVGLDGIQFYSLADDEEKTPALAHSTRGPVPRNPREALQRLEATYRQRLRPVWPEAVDANPRDINILERREHIDPADQDARVPQNLVDARHGPAWQGAHAWLAPRAATLSMMKHEVPDLEACNEVYFVFPQEVRLAAVEFWNYSKTPGRGARELDLSVDDHIIYCGELLSSDDPQLDMYSALAREWHHLRHPQMSSAPTERTSHSKPRRRRSTTLGDDPGCSEHDSKTANGNHPFELSPPGQIVFFADLAAELRGTPEVLHAASRLSSERRGQALRGVPASVSLASSAESGTNISDEPNLIDLSSSLAPEQDVMFFDEGTLQHSARARERITRRSSATSPYRMAEGHLQSRTPAAAALQQRANVGVDGSPGRHDNQRRRGHGLPTPGRNNKHQQQSKPHGTPSMFNRPGDHRSNFGYGVFVAMEDRPTTSVLGKGGQAVIGGERATRSQSHRH